MYRFVTKAAGSVQHVSLGSTYSAEQQYAALTILAKGSTRVPQAMDGCWMDPASIKSLVTRADRSKPPELSVPSYNTARHF